MQALAMILLSDHLMREQGLRREPDGTDAWLRLLEHTGGGGAAVLNRSYECQRAQLTTLAAQMGHLVRNRASLPPGAPFVRWVRSLIPLLPTPSGHDGGLDPTSVVDLCTHLMCNRLGVRLEAEGTLRLLAARALTGASADSGTH
jgi:hypothetical protein